MIDSSPKTIDQAQGIAAAGRGIMFTHTLESEYQPNTDGLVGIPLADIPPLPFIAVWQQSTLGTLGQSIVRQLGL